MVADRPKQSLVAADAGVGAVELNPVDAMDATTKGIKYRAA
jgi:hypothetical protein